MENLKIRVNSEAESKEAQDLFVVLGAVCCSGLERSKNVNFLFMNSGFVTACKLQENFDKSKCKEITLPYLRDLVVLKRNNQSDKTHHDSSDIWKYYVGEKIYCWERRDANIGWHESDTQIDQLIEILKPIEKPMKEYLRKNSNDTYSYIGTVQPEHVSDFMIEIPEGADEFKANKRFYKNGDSFFNIHAMVWTRSTLKKDGYATLWQRPTHPEELPFIDDESPLQTEIESELDQVENLRELLTPYTQPLNDQYAEIEKVRQSAWKKQEGGSHYKSLSIQPMQYALENKLDYAQANVVKYVTRHKEKNGKEDLLKAIHNIELMIEFYYGDEK